METQQGSQNKNFNKDLKSIYLKFIFLKTRLWNRS